MPQGYIRAAVGSFVLAIILVWAGCSSGDKTTIISSNDVTSNVENFFPMAAGSIREYSVSRPGGIIDTVSFEVGADLFLGNKMASEWIAVDRVGARSTSLVVSSPSAIVFYETPNATGETILALPLKAGASWSRFGAGLPDTVNGNNFTGLITIATGKGQPNVTDSTQGTKPGGGTLDAGKNFPIDGSGTLVVDGFETVTLTNGSSYDGAVKLRNGGLGGVNFYWFAPGTGLVKYVFRGQPDGSEVGATVGELIRVTGQ